jgi:hypothetical protein
LNIQECLPHSGKYFCFKSAPQLQAKLFEELCAALIFQPHSTHLGMDYTALSAEASILLARPDIIGCYENSRESACGGCRASSREPLKTLATTRCRRREGARMGWKANREPHPERPIEKSRDVKFSCIYFSNQIFLWEMIIKTDKQFVLN